MKKAFFSFPKRAIAFSLVVLGVAAVVGCNKSLDNDYEEQSNIPAAGLMAFNLTTDKAVGVSLSGNYLTTQALEYGNYTGNYLRIYTGNRTVEARDAYTGNTLATTQPYTFDSSRYYSAFVLGANGAYKNVVVNDNFDSLSGNSGQAYVRYINAIPDSAHTATVTISANGSNVSNATASYGSVSPFTAVALGNVSFTVSKNGVSKERTISLEQQKAYTILLMGAPNSNSVDSVQIRYITNGTLSATDNANGRATSTSQRTTSIN